MSQVTPSAASPLPSLPQEIIDEIIDHTSDCSQTIKTCTLVNHGWLYRARSNLFKNFTFPPKDHPSTNGVDRKFIGEQLQQLIAEMSSSELTTSTFRDSVRNLTINSWYSPQLSDLLSLTGLAGQHGYLSQLPFERLKSVRVEKMYGSCVNPEALTRLIQRNSLLESFVLGLDCVYASSEDFLRLLHNVVISARHLNKLSLSVFTLSFLSPEPENELATIRPFLDSLPAIENPSHLQVLNLFPVSKPIYPGLIEPLLCPPGRFFDLSALQTLAIHDPNEDMLSFYVPLLMHTVPTVTSLKLVLYESMIPQSFDSLHQFNKITYIELVFRLLHTSAGDKTPEAFMNAVLPHLPSIEHLAITFCSDSLTVSEDREIALSQSSPNSMPDVVLSRLLPPSLDSVISVLPETSHPRLGRMTVNFAVSTKNVLDTGASGGTSVVMTQGKNNEVETLVRDLLPKTCEKMIVEAGVVSRKDLDLE